jgi:hypothetical protein
MESKKTTHVLLTLDCGAIDADILRAVSALAGEHNLEVTGLYVENEDLYNAAQLPGLSEVSLTSGEVTTLNPKRILEQVANQARQARVQFESSASKMNLKHSFRVIRGRAADTLLEAAMSSDIVVINRSLRASGMRSWRGSHFEPLVQQHNNLLFVNEPWASGRSVLSLCESHPDFCERTLTTARRFADAEGIELLVIVPPEHADAHLPAADRIILLRSWTEDAIVDLCEREQARLLVLPPTQKLDWRALLLRLIDRVPCSLLRLD